MMSRTRNAPTVAAQSCRVRPQSAFLTFREPDANFNLEQLIVYKSDTTWIGVIEIPTVQLSD